MTDMKCPVCNVGYVHESVNHWCCDYEFCPSYNETDTETYDVLIRTRKALEIATGFIKGISQTVINDCDNQYVVLGNFKKFAQDTLNQIKPALEQKD